MTQKHEAAKLKIAKESDSRTNEEEEQEQAITQRTTRILVDEVAENEIFVFGSNEAGRHGKGAAKTARQWGAILGQAEGLQGKTYGIPTKDSTVTKTLTIRQIEKYVTRFIDFAMQHPDCRSWWMRPSRSQCHRHRASIQKRCTR